MKSFIDLLNRFFGALLWASVPLSTTTSPFWCSLDRSPFLLSLLACFLVKCFCWVFGCWAKTLNLVVKKEIRNFLQRHAMLLIYKKTRVDLIFFTAMLLIEHQYMKNDMLKIAKANTTKGQILAFSLFVSLK